MEPDGSIPHTQVPTTCPYPEPAQSSPYPPIQLREGPSYYPFIYDWLFQGVSFPQVFPQKPPIRLSCPLYALYVPPISFLSI
jgi:hypothetical protein